MSKSDALQPQLQTAMDSIMSRACRTNFAIFAEVTPGSLGGANLRLESNTEHIEPVENMPESLFVTEPAGYLLHASCPGYLEQAEPIYLEKKSMSNISYKLPVIYIRLSRQPSK